MPAIRQYEGNLYRQVTKRDLDSPVGIQVVDYLKLDAELREIFSRVGHEDPLQTTAVKDGNFDGNVVAFTPPATRNVEFAVAHGLGRIPLGWHPVFPAVAGYGHVPLVNLRTADATNLFLKVATADPFHIPGASGVAISATLSQFITLNANNVASTESLSINPVVTAIEITNWSVLLGTAPGGTTSYTFTIRKNGVNTVATITILGPATTGTWSGIIAAVPGDTLVIGSVPSAPAPAAAAFATDMLVREANLPTPVVNTAVIVW